MQTVILISTLLALLGLALPSRASSNTQPQKSSNAQVQTQTNAAFITPDEGGAD